MPAPADSPEPNVTDEPDEPSATCESCGASVPSDDDLVPVHRVYVTPAAWDTEHTEEKVEVVDEVERWCFPCRTLYPHQEIGAT
jgi:hypothetical protein